jgi:hypothetical protein
MTEPFFIPWLFVCGIVLSLVRLVGWLGRRRSGGAATVGSPSFFHAASALGATGTQPTSTGGGYVWAHRGRPMHVTGTQFGKQGPTFFWLGTHVSPSHGSGAVFRADDAPTGRVASLPHLVFRPESRWDRLGKRVGLNREFTAPGVEVGGPLRGRLPEGRGECVYDSTPYGAELQAGDEAFDQRVYVEHEGNSSDAQAFLSNPALRTAIFRAVSHGAEVIVNDAGHGLALRWRVGTPGPVEAGGLARAAEDLDAIARQLPHVESVVLRRSLALPIPLEHIVTGLLFAVVVLSGEAVGARWEPIDPAFRWLVTGTAAFLLIVGTAVGWALTRGRPRGLALFGHVLTGTLLLCPALAATGLTLVNGAGTTATHEWTPRIVDRDASAYRRSPSYYLLLEPRRSGERPVQVRVPESTYRQAAPGATARLVLIDGRLGYEWVREVMVGEADAAK